MNRRGMALLLVLWLIVLLAGVAGISMGRAREGSLHARNRLALIRAGWAREACLEVVLGRARNDSLALRDPIARLTIDSLDLGDGVWCSAHLSDPGEMVHLNRASRGMLVRLFGDSLMADAVMRGRPWPAVEALAEGFGRWKPRLTIRGTGRINLMRASTEVLATVPGMGIEGAREIVAIREGVRGIATLEEVINRMNRSTRERILPGYDRFTSEVGVRTETIVAEIIGHAPQRPVLAPMAVTLIPAGTRLAVVRREVE